MTFLSCSKELPIWNLHFGGQECFWWLVQKHLKAFAVPSERKTTPTLDEAFFPPRTTSPIMWEVIPLCEEKYSTLGTRGFCFQASVFLTPSKHANAHSVSQELQSEHKNSLHVDKEINSL
jgi:hypothetical protein